MDRADTLRAMAKEVLAFSGQQNVEEMITEGDLDGAATYLLGGLDARVGDGMIGEEQATPVVLHTQSRS